MATYYSNTSIVYRLRLDLTQSSQSVTNNTSTVSYALYFQNTGSSAYSYYSSAGQDNISVVINGTTVYSGLPAVSLPGGASQQICSGTITIGHGTDGTKTFSFSASRSGGYVSQWSPGTLSLSGSMTLSTIARASSVSASSSSVTLGNSVTLSISRASSSFTHTLQYAINGGSKTTITSKTSSTSVSWTPPESFSSSITTSTTATCTITCITYNGSTSIGSKTCSITLKIPDNSSYYPTIDSVTISEAVSRLADQFQSYVSKKSKLKVVTSASGAAGSTISSIKNTLDGINYTGTTITTNTVAGSGDYTLTTKVTDSRGRTATTTRTVNFKAYTAPKIKSFKAVRVNSEGIEQEDGEYILFSYSVTASSVNNKNPTTLKFQVKTGSGTWTDVYTISNVYSANTTYRTSSGYTEDEAFTFRLYFRDYFASVSAEDFVDISFSILSFGYDKRSLGIHCQAPNDGTLKIAAPRRNVHSNVVVSNNTDGDYAYTRLIRIDCSGTGTVDKSPIKFTLSKRGYKEHAYLMFFKSGSSITHFRLWSPTYGFSTDIYYRKTSNVYDIYTPYIIAVEDFAYNYDFLDGVKITFPNEPLSALPSGTTKVSTYSSVQTAQSLRIAAASLSATTGQHGTYDIPVATLNTLLGVSNVSLSNTAVFVMDGNGNNSSSAAYSAGSTNGHAHIFSQYFKTSDDVSYFSFIAKACGTDNGLGNVALRFNYLVVYWGTGAS